MTKLRELPPEIARRVEVVNYNGRAFEGQMAQIEATLHHLELAHSVIQFGPYGCESAVVDDPFARRLAELGRDVRHYIEAARGRLYELRSLEERGAGQPAKMSDVDRAAESLRAFGAGLADAGFRFPEREESGADEPVDDPASVLYARAVRRVLAEMNAKIVAAVAEEVAKSARTKRDG